MTVYFHFRREAGNGRQLLESTYIPEMNSSSLLVDIQGGEGNES
jgi:hypothetical protein